MELCRDDQWKKIWEFLTSERLARRVYTGPEEDCKKFFIAVLWMLRSGAQWRLLPKEHGSWNTIYKKFSRWSDKGVFSRMFEHFKNDPDMSALMADSTVVRSHACAAGAPKKNQPSPRT